MRLQEKLREAQALEKHWAQRRSDLLTVARKAIMRMEELLLEHNRALQQYARARASLLAAREPSRAA